MDVKTFFLSENLIEDMYMIQPEGFMSKDGNKVCKLQRSIYGLKQDLGVGIFNLRRQSKSLVSHKILMKRVCKRR